MRVPPPPPPAPVSSTSGVLRAASVASSCLERNPPLLVWKETLPVWQSTAERKPADYNSWKKSAEHNYWVNLVTEKIPFFTEVVAEPLRGVKESQFKPDLLLDGFYGELTTLEGAHTSVESPGAVARRVWDQHLEGKEPGTTDAYRQQVGWFFVVYLQTKTVLVTSRRPGGGTFAFRGWWKPKLEELN